MVSGTTQKPTRISASAYQRISAGAYPMNWDSTFRFSDFKVKHVSLPKDDDKGVVRAHLVRKSEKCALCYKCGSPLKNIHPYSRHQVEDCSLLNPKVQLHFRRGKGRCDQCRKIRLESIEYLQELIPK